MRFLSTIFLLFFLTLSVSGQIKPLDNANPIRISTKITPLPSKAEQVSELEHKLTEAKKYLELVNNGTVAKYSQALEQKRKELEMEEIEKKQLESSEKK